MSKMERLSLAGMMDALTMRQQMTIPAAPQGSSRTPQVACRNCDGVWPKSQMATHDLCKVCERHLKRKTEREHNRAEYKRIHPE